MPLVETHIDDFLRHKLKDKMPVISMFISDKLVNSMKEVFLKEIEDIFPQVLKQFSDNLYNDLDIAQITTDKMMSVSPARLEIMFTPVLRYFRLAGGIAGFIIGIINAVIFLLLT